MQRLTLTLSWGALAVSTCSEAGAHVTSALIAHWDDWPPGLRGSGDLLRAPGRRAASAVTEVTVAHRDWHWQPEAQPEAAN